MDEREIRRDEGLHRNGSVIERPCTERQNRQRVLRNQALDGRLNGLVPVSDGCIELVFSLENATQSQERNEKSQGTAGDSYFAFFIHGFNITKFTLI